MHTSTLRGLAATILLTAAPGAVMAGSGYLQDSRNAIARGGLGNCWHTGSWTAADAVPGCDGMLAPPVTRMTAPPLVSAVTPEPQPPPPPRPCDFDVTLAGDDAFRFDNASLSDAAARHLDELLLQRLPTCSRIMEVTVTGHADRLGDAAYNRKLSEKRAEAVAAWLAGHGIEAPLETRGAGESMPVATCPDAGKRPKTGSQAGPDPDLVACLAPNRRVDIAVHGLRPE